MSQFFSGLGLPSTILNAVTQMGFTQPTPIQNLSIHHILNGDDLIACAQTGSGKTAAYLLPILKRIVEDPKKRALVLVPTRELAEQVFTNVKQLSNNQIQTTVLIGGVDIQKQFRFLKGNPNIIIATPGRLIDHLERKPYLLQNTTQLVLDEGDRMLDMGFKPQLNQILKFLPSERQTLLFSATISKSVEDLAHSYLKNPKKVSIENAQKPVDKINQKAMGILEENKIPTLLKVLDETKGSVIVFVKTKHKTDRLAKRLSQYGHQISFIHGDRSQSQRKAALQMFRDGKNRVLVATDVAARGLDINDVSHVINYDLPQDEESYVHRIGRTARAGKSGDAISFVTKQDFFMWKLICKKYNLNQVVISKKEEVLPLPPLPASVAISHQDVQRPRSNFKPNNKRTFQRGDASPHRSSRHEYTKVGRPARFGGPKKKFNQGEKQSHDQGPDGNRNHDFNDQKRFVYKSNGSFSQKRFQSKSFKAKSA